jgi:hypothetical protein
MMSTLDIYNRIFEVGRPRRRRKWWRGYPPIPIRKFNEVTGGDGLGPAPRGGHPDPREHDGAGGGDGRNGDAEATRSPPPPRDDDEDTFHEERSPMTTTKSRAEELSAFTKRHGIYAVAKCVNERGPYLTETEFTQQINEDCQRTGRNFSKVFCDPGAEGIELRKAALACRDATWIKQGTGRFAGMQLQPILPVWTHERDVGNPKTALQQLNDLANEMKRRAPELSDAQAFSRVALDPRNAALLSRERAEARSRLPTVGGRAVGQ